MRQKPPKVAGPSYWQWGLGALVLGAAGGGGGGGGDASSGYSGGGSSDEGSLGVQIPPAKVLTQLFFSQACRLKICNTRGNRTHG